MHRGNPMYLILWFVLTPFLVLLFMKIGWGVDGILAAMAIAGVVMWLISLAIKKIKGLFPGWEAFLQWSANGKISYDQADNGWQVGGSKEEYDEDDEEESHEPVTTALLTSGMEDLHPALHIPILPTKPKEPPQYAFALGSHTMDMDVLYGTGLIVAPELPSKNGIIWTLATELSRLRVTSLVVDFTGRFDSLPIGNTTGYLLGSPTTTTPAKLQQRFIPLVTKDAGRVGRWLIHQGGQYVLRFHSYNDPVEATTTLLYLLQGMYKWEKEHTEQGGTPSPCIILVNQAHQVLPYQDLYSVANTNPELALRLRTHIEFYLNKGGDLGMHMYLVTDKPTRMAIVGLTQDVWFVQKPQFEELRYLAESTGFPIGAFTQVAPNQALFMDIVNKTSLIVTLPATANDILDDLVLPPITITQANTDTLASTQAVPFFEEETIASSRLPVPFAARGRSEKSPSAPQAPAQAEEDGLDFSEEWLSWASFLYSLGRLKPGTVQHPPQDLYDVADALGLPVEQEKMLNRNRAARMMGYVQALGAEKRSRYAAKAYQVAPQFQRSRARGGAVKIGHDPPSPWQPPAARLVLNPVNKGNARISDEQLERLRATVQCTLDEQHVEADVSWEDICVGPRVIQFGIRPRRYAEMVADRKNPGSRVPKTNVQGEIVYTRTQVSDIMPLEPDFALALNGLNLFGSNETVKIRMVKSIPGTGCVGLEVPNPVPETVTFRQVFESQEFVEMVAASIPLPVAMGKDINGRYFVASLQREPQRITAGETGSGKSVAVNGDLVSILMLSTPEDVRMILIDPKEVELRSYAGLPHLLAPVATTLLEAWPLLKRLAIEMDRRYRILANAEVRNLEKYRQKRKEHPELENLPFLVVVIDEVADLMMQFANKKEREVFEKLICRLLQKGRAAGIHVQLATQRPSVDVLTGLIKANAPARVAFRTASQTDSRVILDEGGAERLLDRGDGLYVGPGMFIRFQRAMLEDAEIERIVAYWCKQKESVDAAGSSSYARYRLPDLPPEAEEQSREEEEESELRGSGEQDTLGEQDPLYPKIIEELPVLAESGQVFSVNKLRYGKLSLKLPSMRHENAVAIAHALQRSGYLGDYSDKRKGYPILVERSRDEVTQEGEEEKATSQA